MNGAPTLGISPPDERFLARDIIEAAAKHAVSVHEDGGCPLTPYGLASCAAAMALVLSTPSHPNHALAIEQHLPPTGVENGTPYDVYCECGLRVTYRFGAWSCPTHRDRATVIFRERRFG